MQANVSVPVLAAIAAAVLFGSAEPAAAATLQLSYSTIYDGTSVITTPAAGTGVVNTPAPPDALTFSHSFSQPTQVIPGTPAPGYGFYDDYIFTVSGVVANAISTTINLGSLFQITDLQQRLFMNVGNNLPTRGAPAGGSVVSWTTPIGTSGIVTVLPTTMLSPGTYVLQTRGNVIGFAGGSYAGSLNVAPVPLPAALPMLLSGLGLLGGAAARRRRTSV